MPDNSSFGVFVSAKAHGNTSKDELRKLCFQSSTGHAHRGLPAARDGQMESMEAVLTMGHKSNKYLSYQLKEVPNFGRQHCGYSESFCRKPLSDTEFNGQMRERLNELGSSGTIVTADLPSSKSTHADSFHAHDRASRRRAKMKSAAPKQRYHNDKRLLETQSFSQTMHAAPSRDSWARGKSVRPVDELDRAQNSLGDSFRTIYGKDFVGNSLAARRSRSESDLRRTR